MDKSSKEFKNLIYDLANGSLDLEHFPVAESKYVENEYEEGKLCSRLYSEMCDDNLMDIGRHLSIKMFEYGQFFNSVGYHI